ncbi:MAG: 3-dehydroquinate synthase [Deltaproteobacteria bacterium]|nr:3-dehydroquinate synthase [Deltaproteobacteria bacterium]
MGGCGLVILIGPPGAGKSSVASSLCKRLGLKCVDLDEFVEERLGRGVSEIIRVEGESRFREYETEALRVVLQRGDVQLLSVGGGLTTRSENVDAIAALNAAQVVCLTSSPGTLAGRLWLQELAARKAGKGAIRPLLVESVSEFLDEEDFCKAVERLVRARATAYDCADIQVFADWADIEVVSEVVEAEAKVLVSERRVVVPVSPDIRPLGKRLARVVLGRGLLDCVGLYLDEIYASATKVLLLTDEVVNGLWGETVERVAKRDGRSVVVATVPRGEAAKQLAEVERLVDLLLENGFNRDDVILALGGGSVGDLAGLTASLYMRGVGLVQVPTTLLAQVDAAIGGKTAVNAKGGKNIIGTFYPAALVLEDVRLLSTLPEREYREGLAEVVKYALIGSSDFFIWLEEKADKITARDEEVVCEMVARCVKEKLRFVAQDVHDTLGKRAQLNFGHTIGHALEGLLGFGEILHGEAVSIGMVQALKIGELLGVSESGLLDRVESLLRKFHLPVEVPADLVGGALASEKWVRALWADKKRSSSGLNFILLSEMGKATQQVVPLSSVYHSLGVRNIEASIV